MRFASDVTCHPAATLESSARSHRLDIYKRQNSAFNRLQTNKLDYSAYDNINDKSPDQDDSDISTSESRRFGGLKKRPCVPTYPNRRKKNKRGRNEARNSGQSDGRTLYDLNFYFLGYQPNRYPVYPVQPIAPIAAVEDTNAVSQYDHYGGYYDCEPNPFYRPPHWVASNVYGNGPSYDDPNRPSYLGLLGQGLFDFVNGLFGYGNSNAGSGGYDTPVSGAAGSVLNDSPEDIKPVFEINVPDTIQALVKPPRTNSIARNSNQFVRFFNLFVVRLQNPNNWRPGQLVGGIQNGVNGFVQEISRYIPF